MLGSGLDDAAAVFLWAICDGAMRRLALTTGTPVERLPEFKMMKELYTLGFMSVTEFQIAKKFIQAHNRVAHGFRSDDRTDVVKAFAKLLSELVANWRTKSGRSSEAP